LKLVDEARIVADGKDFIAMSFALLSYVNKEILFIVDGPDEVETMERLENLVRAFERNSGDTMPN
jgi:phosphotransferase system HPr-like phosphotransfer protein